MTLIGSRQSCARSFRRSVSCSAISPNTFSDKPTPGFGPNYRETVEERMRPPHGEPMPYAESLRNLSHDRLTVWLEPPGWKPQWSAKPFRRGRYVPLNKPEHHFVYFPAQYGIDKPSGESMAADEPFGGLAEGQICGLYGGFMYGPYFAGDTAQLAFLRRASRVARKVTTNKLVCIDGGTLRSLNSPVPRSLRVGFDALEWTRRDPRHLIGVIGYFFRAADACPMLRAGASGTQ